MDYTHPQFHTVACTLDDSGFELTFENQIGKTAKHTRWTHTTEEFWLDVWFSKKKGITIWNNHMQSKRRCQVDEIPKILREVHHKSETTHHLGQMM